LASCLAEVLALNGIRDGTYVEPYAGGAGAALALLYAERVQRIVLNDIDSRLCAFWRAALTQRDEMVRLVERTKVSIQEWKRQRTIYRHPNGHSKLGVAFAVLFLNRCNRSGIVSNGGPIGGIAQAGKWKLDARFNRHTLIRRLDRLHAYSERIEVHNLDAQNFLSKVMPHRCRPEETLVYLDPPYYMKGDSLYLNYYRHDDHAKLARYITERLRYPWVLTYDNVEPVRQLYRGCPSIPFRLPYSARSRAVGEELLIHQAGLLLPAGPLAA
jgi:DNA adenine methylase